MKFQARYNDLVVQTAGEETLVYDLKVNKTYLLNETSAFVWRMCDGTHDVSEISREATRKFNRTASEDLIWLAIDQLKENNLLEKAEGIAIPFAANSRRAMIKKVGLGTMLALPLISMLVAPPAAHAQSSDLACGASCSFDSQCTSGTCNSGACTSNFGSGTRLAGEVYCSTTPRCSDADSNCCSAFATSTGTINCGFITYECECA